MKNKTSIHTNFKVFYTLVAIVILMIVTVVGDAGNAVFAQDDIPPTRESASLQSDVPVELPTDRIIVKLKNEPGASFEEPPNEARMSTLSDKAGLPLRLFRTMADGAQVMLLPEKLPLDEVRVISEALMTLPDIEYAEPDARMVHTLAPNDPQYGNQWHYFGTYGINLPTAWDITTGSASTVVAVVDTGITNHSEFSGRTVPGYDFVSTALDGNDGDARDSDPSDPGDWVTLAESLSGWFVGCPVSNSSWHGTHVAGTIAANSNNASGVAGVNWSAKILPVRVLGKCGGYISDIADGIRWAAGGSVAGVPANANPAKVINVSIGGGGACGATYQEAIDAAVSLGAVVVVAAGNENVDAANSRPANCNNVIAVGATAGDGFRAGYSNFGNLVDISAPGGDTPWDTKVLSTFNSGTTVPSTESYAALQGTSMAAPHVSGVVSLMLAVTPTLTQGQILEILQNTAKDFYPTSNCAINPNTCGAGIVDAAAAVKAARFYNWAGGVSISSSLPLVTVARPHVDAEIASYNGFSSGSLTSYVPMLFRDAFGGSYDSALYVQNVHASNTANVVISYYDSTGSLNCTKNDTIAPRASKGYWLPSVTCTSGSLPTGWVGGVVVTSDQPIVAVGRPHIATEVMTYDGFASGSTEAFVPMLFKGSFGGTYNAAFYIQNVSNSNTANVTLRYYDSSGVLHCTKTETISPLASKGYWVPSATCNPGQGSLPAGWVGGVRVSSDQPIVTVGRPHIGAQVTTYNGFTGGSTSSFVPMLFRDAFGGSYDSALYVQNTNSTTTANVSLYFYGSNGNLDCIKFDTITPYASKGYWVPTMTCDVGSLYTGWAGGVRIYSDNAQPIVSVGRPHIGDQVTTYGGASSGSSLSYQPMLFKDAFGGSYDSAMYLQNTDFSNPASVTLSFYNANGAISCTKTDTIPAGAIKGYWLPSLTCDP